MIIVDTGPLVAAPNARDNEHKRSAAMLQQLPRPLVIPAPVLTEVCYLLSTRANSKVEAAFLTSLAVGEFRLEPTTSADLHRMAELVSRYDDLPLGAVDASVVAVAERLRVRDIATLDRRHFYVVRPRHPISAFTLHP